MPQWYPVGSRPRILINWDTFVAQGIDPAWQGPFTDCIINAYTRWMNIAGVNCRPQFHGYTTQVPPTTQGDLLILMTPWHGGGAPNIATTLGGWNSIYIEFHRRSGANGTPWNYVPWNAMPGQVDMQTVALHEFGHALGLNHSASGNDTMFPFYRYPQRYGPFENDVASLKALYPDYQQNRMRQLRSPDGAASWLPTPNELASHAHWHTRTNQSPGIAAFRGSGLYVLGWTHSNRIPTWLRNDGEKFLTRIWHYFGGERTVHGPAFASDDRGTVLWARVTNEDSGTLRLSRSTNHARSWTVANLPAGARSAGMPGIAWTRVAGRSCWVLVWSHFDRTDDAATGQVRASTSFDDGATWSLPTMLRPGLKALSGVSVAATDDNRLMIALAFANPAGIVSLNEIVTVPSAVAGHQLQAVTAPMFTGERTRTQPALAYDHARDTFILAWREQNFNTTLGTLVLAPGGTAWSGRVWLLAHASHVAPALATSPELGETVLWYAHE